MSSQKKFLAFTVFALSMMFVHFCVGLKPDIGGKPFWTAFTEPR